MGSVSLLFAKFTFQSIALYNKFLVSNRKINLSTQRRQWKLMKEGKKTSMTQKKIDILNDAGFVWEARPNDNKSDSDKEDADDSSLSDGGKAVPMKTEETSKDDLEEEKAKSESGQAAATKSEEASEERVEELAKSRGDLGMASTSVKTKETEKDEDNSPAKSGYDLGTTSTSIKAEEADEDEDTTVKSGDGQVTSSTFGKTE